MTAFEKNAATYRSEVDESIAFIGVESELFTRLKVSRLLEAIAEHVGDPATCTVLDVGCGVGETDAHLAGRVGELHGVDPAGAAVDAARSRNPGVEYAVASGTELPFADNTFDVGFAICVLHHVPRVSRPAMAREVGRVVRPGGLVAIFEHNPLNPLTRLAVSRCAFDDDAELLWPREARQLLEQAGCTQIATRNIVFFPSERVELQRLERHLARVPLGAQYVVTGTVG